MTEQAEESGDLTEESGTDEDGNPYIAVVLAGVTEPIFVEKYVATYGVVVQPYVY